MRADEDGETQPHNSFAKIIGEKKVGYTGLVYFGSQMEPANMIFDTGSQFITVTSASCRDCETAAYDPGNSSLSMVTKDTHTIHYKEREMELHTKIYEDKVCLNKKHTEAR